VTPPHLRPVLLAILAAVDLMFIQGCGSPYVVPGPYQYPTPYARTTQSFHPLSDYSGLDESHWIKENVDRGSVIILEDHSIWEIHRLDRIDARLWLKLSNIRVVESTDGSPGYDYLIINTDDRESVHAKYLGKDR
jgi:hypothetical protein